METTIHGARSALTVGLGDTVICLIDEWRRGEKSDFDGTVMGVTDSGVDVLYLSGYRSRNDFVPWADVLAKLDKRAARVSVPGTSYEGHFVLAPNVQHEGPPEAVPLDAPVGRQVATKKGTYMACPKCGCKETYQYDNDEDPNDDRLQRCAACGEVFDLEDELPEDDELPGMWECADFTGGQCS